ncbi:MAG: PAS domain-containing protein [Clostridia bacterium]|nr:PAS domain-containing protein [Clostridia bacterium]
MNNNEDVEDILTNHIYGFHKYSLNKPFHITFASKSFCEILKIEQEKLVSNKDKYIKFIHDEDKTMYETFLFKLSQKEQTLSLQYKLVLKNGTVLYVNDTMSSKRLPNGEMVGYSTLNNMTELVTDKRDLFLGKGNPCGFVKYTCEKQPKITYMNKKMMEILKIPENKDGELDYLELYKSNVYLIIPIEERKKFHHLLNRVSSNTETITGELTLLRCDGTKARVFGWITKQINEQGEAEFQSVMIDVSDRFYQQKESELDVYVNSLSQVYDKIFVYDYANKTVKYIYGKNSKTSTQFKDMPVRMEDAIKQFIKVNVDKKYQEEVQQFFNDNYERRFNSIDNKPLQVRFKAKFSDGVNRLCSGIFLKINLSVSLFCIRCFDELEASSLLSENKSLRNMQENMQKLFMRLTEGIVAFEINENHVKLMYNSENVCRFLGCTKEEYALMREKENLTIEEVISKSEILTLENVNKLLSTGEAEFPYFDVTTNRNRRIKAVCTQESIDNTQSRFVILYNVPDDETKELNNSNKSNVYIRTFGYFDVFVNDKPIAFKNKKSKELLALLVDRRGGFVTSEEAISFLWEDEDANPVTLSRYRKVALRLKNILEEYGIAEVIESVDGKRRIDISKVRCDLFDYLSGNEQYSQLFKGTYLTNYSWGEATLSELLGNYYN